jgi:uncharacterized protein (UPF0332 family)
MITISALAADAEALLPAGSEARARTVISRAYYAAYHACLKSAKQSGYQYTKSAGGTHWQLFMLLRDVQDKKLKRAGARLEGLFDRRLDADYRLYVPLTAQSADECIETMSEILEMLGPVP